MMSLKTEQRLIDQLYESVMAHPHKDELLTLMHEQLIDDADLNGDTSGD